ncbi:hypothetical protein ACQKNB_16340 [Lysinibacillus xylanilyticus]
MQVEVIKIGDDVVSGYPTGGGQHHYYRVFNNHIKIYFTESID